MQPRAFIDERSESGGRGPAGSAGGEGARPLSVDGDRGDRGDRVVVALDVPAGATVALGGVWPEGQALRDAYTGAAYVARGGSIRVERAARAVLLEAVR